MVLCTNRNNGTPTTEKQQPHPPAAQEALSSPFLEQARLFTDHNIHSLSRPSAGETWPILTHSLTRQPRADIHPA